MNNNFNKKIKKHTDIRTHYNTRPNISKQQRNESKTINIKYYNNFIKSVLINEYVLCNDTILDLACGKGGDIGKYSKKYLKKYVGIDIADNSIQESKKRANGVKYDTCFYVKDVFNELFTLGEQFNVISCQFALHYAFGTENMLNIAVENVVNHLKNYGYFIVTIADGAKLMRKYLERKDENSRIIDNSYCYIEVPPESEIKIKEYVENKNKNCFGIEYYFNLEDAVELCLEYFADTDILVEKLKKKGVDLKCEITFQDFYAKYEKYYREMYKKMNVKELNSKEIEVIGIYKIMVFSKIRK